MKFLAVATSTHRYHVSGHRTGMWFGEYTSFYNVVTRAGHEVDLASIVGGVVPLDPMSLSAPFIFAGGANKRYEDAGFMDTLDTTPALATVPLQDYGGIYLVGGHGTMFDFEDEALKAALAHFATAGKIISAVCHGPAGLLDVPLADGTHLLDGRSVTGYTWAEEKLARRSLEVPFSLEEKLTQQAGKFSAARMPMSKHVIVDDFLVTGQNPMSAAGVAEAVLELL
ncbi:type 1 glutamine amidotransferase domain-containing protein [Corynebacterium mayonis]|uniref:type 1 glutamine amidotransferase domain-containing protein n=1 Tax=Corynebacterium mayonis TaxID=3062461 RepID=UPI003140A6F7